MSNTVDSKVVEMRFDNKDFESNVKTSLSTLDKLKQSLRLDGASKGLENVSASAKKIDFTQIESTACQAGFHIQDVWLKLSNVLEYQIARKIISIGKDIVNAFAIQPVTTGLNEYEMKMNSVQTIMMSTGESIDTVNKYLDELNTYSDRTIYSFQDMTSNIGKFTNAGVELEDAVAAIKGVSNEAAISGANANEASRAMYNFAQALSAGYVKLIDWKSIENANMATKEFKQELINTAVEMGTLTKTTDDMYSTGKTTISSTKNFNDSLQDQWMTSEVLIETLKRYADEQTTIGAKAYEAAEKVKTFSQMMDVLKETAQSGWAKTWELIFGNLEEAKSIFTPLTNFLGSIISSIDDFRNKVIEGALGVTSPFANIIEKVSSFTGEVEDATETFAELGDVVNRVISGEFGNGQARWDALTEAGYNWAQVQNAVNEQLGCSVRHEEAFTDAIEKQTESTKSLTDAQLKKMGLDADEIKLYRQLEKEAKAAGMSVEEYSKSLSDANKSGRDLLIEGFKNIGSTMKEIGESAKKAWNEIFPNTQQNMINGLYNLIKGFRNLTASFTNLNGDSEKLTRTFKGLFALLDIVTTIIGGPFKLAIKLICKALGTMDVDILSVTAAMGDAIVAFRDFIFKNKVVEGILKKVGEGIVFLVGKIKELITYISKLPKVQSAIENLKNIDFSDLGNSIVTGIKNAFAKIKSFNFREIGTFIIEGLQNGLGDAGGVFDKIIEIGKTIISKIKEVLGIHSPSTEMYDVGLNVIEGLVNGIKDGLSKVKESASEVAETITEFFGNLDWGGILAGGLSIGLITTCVKLASSLENLTEPLAGLGEVFEGTGKILSKSAKPIARILNSTAKVVKSFSKVMNAFAFSIQAKALRDIAISLAILVGALWLITKIDEKKLWEAVSVMGHLALILGLLAFAMSKMSGDLITINKDGASIDSAVPKLLALAVAIGALGLVVKMLGKMDEGQLSQGMNALIGLMGVTMLLMAATEAITKTDGIDGVGKTLSKIAGAMLVMAVVVKILGKMDQGEITQGMICVGLLGLMIGSLIYAISLVSDNGNVENVGKTLSKIAGAMLVMAIVVKILGKMEQGEIEQGMMCIGLLGGLIVGLMYATKYISDCGNVENIGGTLMKIAGAIAIMAIVVKMLGKMDQTELTQGMVCIGLFGLLIMALMATTKLVSDNGNVEVIGGTLLAIAGAIAIMGLVVKILGKMEIGELAKGIIAVGFLGLIVVGLMYAIKKIGGPTEALKIGGTLLAMSIAIGILAAIAVILGFVSVPNLAKGIIAVGCLSVMMGMLIKTTKDAQNCEKTIIAMAICIGVIAASVLILSFLKPEKLSGATACMSILMGVLALVIKSASNMQGSVASLIVMTVAIGLIAFVIYKLAKLPVEQVIGVAAGLSIVLLALAASMYLISNSKSFSGKTLANLGMMVLMLVALGGILYLLKDLKVDDGMVKAGLAVAAIMLLAIGFGYLANYASNMTKAMVSLLIMAVAMEIFADVCSKFSSIDWSGIIKAGAAMGGLLILVAALSMIGSGFGAGMLIGAAAMLVMAAAISVFAPALQTLGSMSWSEIARGLVALAASFAIIGAASLILAPVIPLILLLSASIALLGVGFIAIGAGLNMVAAGIVALSAAMSVNLIVITTGITLIATTLLNLIPLVIQKIGEGIVLLCQVITTNAPIIAQTVITVITSILEVLNTTIPLIVECIVSLLDQLLQTLADHMPSIVQSGMDILLALLQGIRDNIGEIVTTVGDIIVNILEALAEKLPDIIQAGVDLVLALINGMANGIRDNADEVKAALDNLCSAMLDAVKTFFGIHSPSTVFAEIGGNLILGLKNGISNKISETVSKVKELGTKLLNAIKEKANDFKEKGKDLMDKLKTGLKDKQDAVKAQAKSVMSNCITGIKDKLSDFKDTGGYLMDGLKNGISAKIEDVKSAVGSVVSAAIAKAKELADINSPSKVFAEIGMYMDEGLVVGLKQYSKKVADAAGEISETAIENSEAAFSKLSDVLSGDVDINPTITPVVDMANVGDIGNMGAMRLNADIDTLFTQPVASLTQIFDSAKAEIKESNQKVIDSVNGLREDLTELYSTDQELGLYVDGKKLASTLAKPMNRQLNVLAMRGAY